jgi:TatD DNase family protein
MIDTHAHVSARFCENAGEIVDGAKANGINKIILAASNIEESEENIELAEGNELFKAAVGIHPQQTDPEIELSIDEQIIRLDELATKKVVVAIGECGLDYATPPPEEKERSKREQEILLRGQIVVAIKHKLPLIIHARKAVDETIEILKTYKNLSGVFHCYAGGKKRVNKVLELGDNWYFGIDGNITYEDGLVEVINNIPKDRLILETDSPFLTPVPYRGESNKPEYVKYVYQKVADIWGVSLEQTEKIIDENAKRLFNL